MAKRTEAQLTKKATKNNNTSRVLSIPLPLHRAKQKIQKNKKRNSRKTKKDLPFGKTMSKKEIHEKQKKGQPAVLNPHRRALTSHSDQKKGHIVIMDIQRGHFGRLWLTSFFSGFPENILWSEGKFYWPDGAFKGRSCNFVVCAFLPKTR